VVAAYRGAFSAAVAAGIRVTGTELVCNLNVDAGQDTLRCGKRNDTLVSDSDTSLSGLGGTDLLVSANRATTPSSLARDANISSLDKSHAPAPPPVIDRTGQVTDLSSATARPSWLEAFVNDLGSSGDPDSKIRIRL
jgi:hypothetical protein